MPVLYSITYLPECRVERFAGSRGNYYELPDGSHLDVRTEPVWCACCRRVVDGESIPTIESLDKELADLDDPASNIYRFFKRPLLLPKSFPPDFRDDIRRTQIEETRKRRQWRLGRCSPAKCIRCGSIDIVSLPYDQPITITTEPNPITLRLQVVGLCSTYFNEWFYTPEGDRILRETKPAYWASPGANPSDVDDDRRYIQQSLATKGKARKLKDQQSEGGEKR